MDLEGTIKYAETAVRRTPENHDPCVLHNYLSSWYEYTRNVKDLEGAIKYAETAVQEPPEDHPHKSSHVADFVNRLCTRDERSGNLENLEATIYYVEIALIMKEVPDDHPRCAIYLSSPARSLCA